MTDQPSVEVVRGLQALGLDARQIESLLSGETVVYLLPTKDEPGVAMIQYIGDRLRSGIIEINDVGGGLEDFLLFRDRSMAAARALGVAELEIFGGAVVNPVLESILIRWDFERSEDAVPDELGGGTMEILSKVFSVRGAEE